MVDTVIASPVIAALHDRRSSPVLRSDRPSRREVERIIEAAGWAPNHHKTEPWRFVVLTGQALHQMGEVMAQGLQARVGDPDSDASRVAIEKERRKPLRAPVVIAVWVCPADSSKVVREEENMATAAAVQNMLLAAEALGLGAMWRTGPAASDPAVKHFLGIPTDAIVAAFVYLGYPQALPPRTRTRDALQYAQWRGWQD